MIRHIVFITPVTFNASQHRWFGLDYLQKNNLHVEVWDVTSFVQPKESAAVFSKDSHFDSPMLFRLNSYKELAANLEEFPRDSLVVCFFGYQLMYYKVLRLLTKHRARYAYLMNYPVPTSSLASRMQNGGVKYFFSWAKRLPNIVKHRLFVGCPPALLGIAAPKYILAGGEKSLVHPHVLGKGTEIVWLHCFDCEELYSADRQPADQNLGKFAVFIDQCLPFHPDTLTGSNRAAIMAENYYPLLGQFFRLMEKIVGYKIVIAAHPRANYTDNKYFGGRAVIKGCTSELVRHSEFVLMHCSAAISYVVMFQKPCLFLTTRHFKGSHTWHETETMARILGTEPIFMDNMVSYSSSFLQKFLKPNEEKYRQYWKDFLKSPKSEDVSFWEGFLKIIRKETRQLEPVVAGIPRPEHI